MITLKWKSVSLNPVIYLCAVENMAVSLGILAFTQQSEFIKKK